MEWGRCAVVAVHIVGGATAWVSRLPKSNDAGHGGTVRGGCDAERLLARSNKFSGKRDEGVRRARMMMRMEETYGAFGAWRRRPRRRVGYRFSWRI